MKKIFKDQVYPFKFGKEWPNDVSRIAPHLLSKWAAKEHVPVEVTFQPSANLDGVTRC